MAFCYVKIAYSMFSFLLGKQKVSICQVSAQLIKHLLLNVNDL